MEDLELDQVDFKSAYLNGEIEEEVYIKLPDGYKQGREQSWQTQQSNLWHQAGREPLACKVGPGFPPHGIHQV